MISQMPFSMSCQPPMWMNHLGCSRSAEPQITVAPVIITSDWRTFQLSSVIAFSAIIASCDHVSYMYNDKSDNLLPSTSLPQLPVPANAYANVAATRYWECRCLHWGAISGPCRSCHECCWSPALHYPTKITVKQWSPQTSVGAGPLNNLNDR